MASLKAEVLLREFNYNGVRIPDPAPQMSVDAGQRSAHAYLSGDCNRNPHRSGRHRNRFALHLQPRDRIEGLSRVQVRGVTRGTGRSVHPKGRRATPGSQSDSGEASEMQRILRSRTRSLRSDEPAEDTVRQAPPASTQEVAIKRLPLQASLF